jgi:hypothetical protein
MRRSALTSAPLALVLLATGVPALAQDTTPSPIPPPSPVAGPSSSDLVDAFPASLGDQPWQQLSVVTGPQLFAGLDPLDPQDAERIAEHEGLLQAANATIDDLTSVTGFRIDVDGAYAFVSAYRIAGADPAVMADVVEAWFVASYAEAMQEPRMDRREIAGREAVALWDEALVTSSGEVQPSHFYTSGDTVWVVNVDDSLLVEAFESLPLDAPR